MQPETENIWTRIWTETAAPSERNAVGTTREGQYRVEGNTVHVEDAHGEQLGSRTLQPGDDAKTIARRILREAGSANEHSRFYRPIDYPPRGGWV